MRSGTKTGRSWLARSSWVENDPLTALFHVPASYTLAGAEGADVQKTSTDAPSLVSVVLCRKTGGRVEGSADVPPFAAGRRAEREIVYGLTRWLFAIRQRTGKGVHAKTQKKEERIKPQRAQRPQRFEGIKMASVEILLNSSPFLCALCELCGLSFFPSLRLCGRGLVCRSSMTAEACFLSVLAGGRSGSSV